MCTEIGGVIGFLGSMVSFGFLRILCKSEVSNVCHCLYVNFVVLTQVPVGNAPRASSAHL